MSLVSSSTRLSFNSLPPRWTAWAGMALLLSYGIFIGANFAPVAAGADSGGYFNSARLLTEGRFTTPLRTVPEFKPALPGAYIPLGYTEEQGTTILKPTYPIGLPMHYAAASLLAGWYWGPLGVGVFAAMAAVYFCFRCLRELNVSPGLAFTGAAALAVSPMYLFSAFVPMSDVVATAWCTIAVYAALRARDRVRWSLLCGAAFSVAVLVRPTNAILLPTLALLLWNWRNLAGAFVGGIPGALWLGFYNKVMYGSPLRSGYGSIFDAFGWAEFSPSLHNYLDTMPWVLPLVFPAVLLLPFLPWKTQWRVLAAFVLWCVSFALFYAYYDITKLAWWYLRFLLPAFPTIIVLGMAGIEGLVGRVNSVSARNRDLVAAVLVLAVSLWTSVHWCKLRHVMLMKPYQQPYLIACDWAQKNMPKDAIVACMQTSSAFYFYTDLPILRWDQVQPEDRLLLEGRFREAKRPVYAVLFPFEQDDALKQRLPWAWEKVTELKDCAVWKLKLTPAPASP